VKFIGDENKKAAVVISNSLIYQYVGARQKEYKYYVDFYLKKLLFYKRFHQLIG